ncbi:hypothetical protein BF14_030480 [Streptomyces griseus]|nr:hypothetical protein DIJ69_30545 [Streptomyces globisporus]PPA43613.1 hypothetical protein BF14_030480 [Streptomyces griseus]RAN20857.1 hypothetical protein A3838_29825 [Streptomyces badius]RAN28787.1 hypothetical protein A3800_29835 [Streptomyces badius]
MRFGKPGWLLRGEARRMTQLVIKSAYMMHWRLQVPGGQLHTELPQRRLADTNRDNQDRRVRLSFLG